MFLCAELIAPQPHSWRGRKEKKTGKTKNTARCSWGFECGRVHHISAFIWFIFPQTNACARTQKSHKDGYVTNHWRATPVFVGVSAPARQKGAVMRPHWRWHHPPWDFSTTTVDWQLQEGSSGFQPSGKPLDHRLRYFYFPEHGQLKEVVKQRFINLIIWEAWAAPLTDWMTYCFYYTLICPFQAAWIGLIWLFSHKFNCFNLWIYLKKK